MEACFGALCVLCTNSSAVPARANVQYIANGDCTLTPVGGDVVLGGEYALAPGQMLDGNEGVVLRGGLVVDGANVKIRNIKSSRRLRVIGTEAQNTSVENFQVLNDDVAVSIVGGGGLENTVDMTNSRLVNVTGGKDAAVSLLHAVGRVDVTCASADDFALVQHYRAFDTAIEVTNCRLLNLTAIFDAYGSAFMFDVYGRDDPEWFGALERLNVALALGCVGFYALARKTA